MLKLEDIYQVDKRMEKNSIKEALSVCNETTQVRFNHYLQRLG